MVDDGNQRDSAPPAGYLPFDPALGVAMLGEIQAEGLRAAGALVERLVHLVDGPHVVPTTDEDADAATEAPPPGRPPPADMGAVLPWFDLWNDLLERTTDTLQRFRGADVGPAGEGVQVGVDGSLVPTHPLTIDLDSARRGRGEMWLHNGTPDDHGELVPRCGPLTDVHGSVLDGEVEIDPPKIDGLPSRSSRGFTIAVAVEPSAPAGTYRGVVQMGGADAVWMPLEVLVPASAP